jgi:hypothetical protein
MKTITRVECKGAQIVVPLPLLMRLQGIINGNALLYTALKPGAFYYVAIGRKTYKVWYTEGDKSAESPIPRTDQ